jgi:hypothetical protein
VELSLFQDWRRAKTIVRDAKASRTRTYDGVKMTSPFDEFVSLKQFGEMLNPPKCERTMQRWMNLPKNPLPVVALPKGNVVHVPTGFAWMMGLMRTGKPTRRQRRR